MQDLSPLDRENHPEVLRAFAKLVVRDNELKDKKILRLQGELARRELEEKQLKLAIDTTLNSLRNQLFGGGQEKLQDPSRSRGQEEKQLLLHSQSFAPPPREAETAKLPTNILEYQLSDAKLIAESQLRGYPESSRSDWEEIKGLYDESKETTVTERTYQVLVHRRKKYRFLPAQGTDHEIIVTAPGPEKLLPGCSYSIDFALSLVRDKYCDHIPLERQTRRMASDGLKGMGTKTLYNLCRAVAVHHEGVVKEIRQDVLSVPVAVHCDETPWKIFGKKDADSGYMWVISNQAGAYYQYEPTRSGAVIEEMLKGYQGPILSDGYSGYNRMKKLPGITVANCWPHARRYFFKIQENYPRECHEIIKMMDDLASIERKARDWESLEKLRQEESKPLTESILKWLYQTKPEHLGQSEMTKAIDYTLNHWEGLTAFLKDKRIPLSNNDAERAIRHSVMGRKNFYGSQSIDGADITATLYTVIESCKRVELEPVAYMRYVIGQNNRCEKPLTPLAYARQIRAS